MLRSLSCVKFCLVIPEDSGCHRDKLSHSDKSHSSSLFDQSSPRALDLIFYTAFPKTFHQGIFVCSTAEQHLVFVLNHRCQTSQRSTLWISWSLRSILQLSRNTEGNFLDFKSNLKLKSWNLVQGMSLFKSSFSNAVKLLVLLRRCVLFRPHLEPWRNYLSWVRQLGRGSFSEGPPPSPHNFGERSPPPPSSSLSTQQGVFSVLLSQPFAHNISKRSPPPILEPQPTKPSLFAFL